MVTSTGSAFAAIWRVLNGHAPSTRADIRTVLGAGSLLAVWLTVIGAATWIFVAWDTVLIGGIGAALWRLRHPAEREYFNVEARAELRRSAEAAGRLSLVCLIILAVMFGSGHTAIAAMNAPWPTLLAIAAAGIMVGCLLPVERHLRSALAVAKREYEAYAGTRKRL